MKTKFFILLCLLCFVFATQAQEFSTKLYFETAQGEKDSLEIGYDPAATIGIDQAFGEVNYGSPISPDNKFQVFFIDPWWSDYICPPFQSGFYSRKQIINKDAAYETDKLIGISIPLTSLPLTISWDGVQSGDTKSEECFFADWRAFRIQNRILGMDWNKVIKKDLKQKDSILFSTIDATYDYYEYVADDFSFFSEPVSFYVIYLGLFNPGIHLSEKQIGESKDISVSPNPVTDICYIEKGNIEIKQIDLFTVSGEKVMSVDKETSTIDCSSLPTGIYVVVMETTGNEKEYYKLIKK